VHYVGHCTVSIRFTTLSHLNISEVGTNKIIFLYRWFRLWLGLFRQPSLDIHYHGTCSAICRLLGTGSKVINLLSWLKLGIPGRMLALRVECKWPGRNVWLSTGNKSVIFGCPGCKFRTTGCAQWQTAQRSTYLRHLQFKLSLSSGCAQCAPTSLLCKNVKVRTHDTAFF
jgi:hypothetical protein